MFVVPIEDLLSFRLSPCKEVILDLCQTLLDVGGHLRVLLLERRVHGILKVSLDTIHLHRELH